MSLLSRILLNSSSIEGLLHEVATEVPVRCTREIMHTLEPITGTEVRYVSTGKVLPPTRAANPLLQRPKVA